MWNYQYIYFEFNQHISVTLVLCKFFVSVIFIASVVSAFWFLLDLLQKGRQQLELPRLSGFKEQLVSFEQPTLHWLKGFEEHLSKLWQQFLSLEQQFSSLEQQLTPLEKQFNPLQLWSSDEQHRVLQLIWDGQQNIPT